MSTLDLYITQLRLVAATQRLAADAYDASGQRFERDRALRNARWMEDRADRFERAS